MTTDEAFLRDICEHPDDEAPRLVYADWLDEHGRPERAEFIRVECELEHTEEHSPRWRQLSVRQLALIRAHKKEWAAPFKGWTYSTRFRRGFVEMVLLSPKQFTARAAELFRLAPVRILQFTRLNEPNLMRVAPATVEALAAMPELRRASGLGFGNQFLTDDVLQAFLAAADLRHLTGLSLNLCRLTITGLEALAAAPGLAGLSGLNLHGNNLNDGAVAALVRAPAFRLEALDLTRNQITDAGARALAASPSLAGLRKLSLWGNQLTDEGFRALVQSPHLVALTHLEVGLYGMPSRFTEASLRALAQSPAPPRLTALDLGGSLVADPGLAALAGYPHLDALRRLDLSKSATRLAYIDAARITDAGARLLASLPALGGLRWLNLANNALTDAGAQALLAAPHLAGLGHLNLKGSRISAETQRAFRQRYGPGVCTFSRP
jgi:uncharacterized protein (TIGR02996 family)